MAIAAGTTTEIASERRRLSSSAYARLGIILSGASLVVAFLALVYYLVMAISWFNQPFPGVILTAEGTVSSVTPGGTGTWPGLAAGLKADDVILRFDDLFLEGKTNGGALINS